MNTPDSSPYLAWLLAAKLAEWQGMEVGIKEDPYLPHHFCLVIGLPSGNVVLDIPKEEMVGNWRQLKTIPHESGSNTEQKIYDCLNGYLVHHHTLVIPEKKDDQSDEFQGQ